MTKLCFVLIHLNYAFTSIYSILVNLFLIRKFRKNDIQTQLEAQISSTEYPPLSMAQVARNLGYDESHLYRRFPELCKQIAARYIEYSKLRGDSRLAKLGEELEKTIKHLISRGIYPSQKQVGLIMGRGIFKDKTVELIYQRILINLGY